MNIPDKAVETAIGRMRGSVTTRDILAILEAAAPFIAAKAIAEAADKFHARLPDGTGNGRAYNSHQVAVMLRAQAEVYRS